MKNMEFSAEVQALLNKQPKWWIVYGNYLVLMLAALLLFLLSTIRTESISSYTLKSNAAADCSTCISIPLSAAQQFALEKGELKLELTFSNSSARIPLEKADYRLTSGTQGTRNLKIDLENILHNGADADNAVLTIKQTNLRFLTEMTQHLLH